MWCNYLSLPASGTKVLIYEAIFAEGRYLLYKASKYRLTYLMTWISNYIPQNTVWCNYLSLPASGTKVLIYEAIFAEGRYLLYKASKYRLTYLMTWISNYIPQNTVWCNYLSLPASGTKVLIQEAIFAEGRYLLYKASKYRLTYLMAWISNYIQQQSGWKTKTAGQAATYDRD